MKRETKFRAWDTITKTYWYDCITIRMDGTIDYLNELGAWTQDSENRFILEQFTGLRDKSNPVKDIYEGDLFQTKHSNYLDEVYYDERDSGFRLRFNGEMQYDKTKSIMFAHCDVIVGNVRQNPELKEKNYGKEL